MTAPNLFIVGAGKSGTTSLFEYMAQHPDIHACPVKEPHFYSLALDATEGPWDSLDHIATATEYASLFEGGAGHRYRMEASASYLYYPGVPELIKTDSADARIVILPRDPVSRAFSDYRHQRRIGNETQTFEDALARERSGGRGYLAQGRYADQVARYIDGFGRDAVWIRLFETFFADVTLGLAALYEWLGLALPANGPLHLAHNAGGERVPRWPAAYATARAMGRWLPESVRSWGRRRLSEDVRLSEQTRAELVEHYRSDIARLGASTDLDLSPWGPA